MNIPDSLFYKIINKKCILFLGAGATKNCGGLLGSELKDYIFSKIGDTGVEKCELSRYTYNLFKKGYKNEVEEIIRQRLKNLTPTKEFEKISQIPWKSIYTTNYDDLIEKSYNNQGYFECKEFDSSKTEVFIDNSTIPLYKICGSITNTDPLLITTKELKDFKKNSQHFVKLLLNELNDTFVFVGYSFSDNIISNLLESFSDNDDWDTIKEKYIILPNITEELKTDLEIFNIKYIEGTVEEFFTCITERINKSTENKLQCLKFCVASDSPLSELSPRTKDKISGCFDFYNKEQNYATDQNYFYKGGIANWGVIKNDFDVSRQMIFHDCLKNEDKEIDTEELYYTINELNTNKQIYKIKITGPAVSGKTTLIYRLAYELTNLDNLTFVYKQQSKYSSGLLLDLYNSINKPIIIIFDDISVNFDEFNSILDDAQKYSIPVTLIITTRNSDWEKCIGSYNKKKIEPFDFEIDIKDNIEKKEAQKLVNKMLGCNLINCSTEFELSSVINKIVNSHNLIDILFQLSESNSTVENSICTEYDNLTEVSQVTCGIVSLCFVYGFKLRWQLLERTLEEKLQNNFTWEDFINEIIKKDAKGNLFQDEIQGEYFISGRHRYISKLMIDIHYKGNYSEQIKDIKNLIRASKDNYYEEIFIGKIINSIYQNDNNFSQEQLNDLFNFAIDKFTSNNNKAFINHLKGEFLLSNQNYCDAIRCFDTNLQNNLNKMYSFHSIGKAYFYYAKTENTSSGKFRNLINQSIKYLFEGIDYRSDNDLYYSLLFKIFTYLEDNKCISEQDNIDFNKLQILAKKNLDINDLQQLDRTYKDNM